MNQVVLHSSTSYGIFSQEKYMVGTSVQNLQSKLMDLSPVLMERPGLQYKDMNMIRCCENFVCCDRGYLPKLEHQLIQSMRVSSCVCSHRVSWMQEQRVLI